MNLSGLFSFTLASGKKSFLFLFSNFFKKGLSFFFRFKSEFSDFEFGDEKFKPDELFVFY
jgi:hypothetical protein